MDDSKLREDTKNNSSATRDGFTTFRGHTWLCRVSFHRPFSFVTAVNPPPLYLYHSHAQSAAKRIETTKMDIRNQLSILSEAPYTALEQYHRRSAKLQDLLARITGHGQIYMHHYYDLQ